MNRLIEYALKTVDEVNLLKAARTHVFKNTSGSKKMLVFNKQSRS